MSKNGDPKKYLRLKIDHFKADQKLGCAVFLHLPLNKKIVQLKKQDDTFSQASIDRFKAKGHAELLILDPKTETNSFHWPQESLQDMNPPLPADFLPTDQQEKFSEELASLPSHSEIILPGEIDLDNPQAKASPQSDEDESASSVSASANNASSASASTNTDNDEKIVSGNFSDEQNSTIGAAGTTDDTSQVVKGHQDSSDEEVTRIAAGEAGIENTETRLNADPSSDTDTIRVSGESSFKDSAKQSISADSAAENASELRFSNSNDEDPFATVLGGNGADNSALEKFVVQGSGEKTADNQVTRVHGSPEDISDNQVTRVQGSPEDIGDNGVTVVKGSRVEEIDNYVQEIKSLGSCISDEAKEKIYQIKNSDKESMQGLDITVVKQHEELMKNNQDISLSSFGSSEERNALEESSLRNPDLESSIHSIDTIINEVSNNPSDEVIESSMQAADKISKEAVSLAVRKRIYEDIIDQKEEITDKRDDVIKMGAHVEKQNNPEVISAVRSKIKNKAVAITKKESQLSDTQDLIFKLDNNLDVDETLVKAYEEQIDDTIYTINPDAPFADEIIRVKGSIQTLQTEIKDVLARKAEVDAAFEANKKDYELISNASVIGQSVAAQTCSFALTFTYAIGYRDFSFLKTVAQASYLSESLPEKDKDKDNQSQIEVSAFAKNLAKNFMEKERNFQAMSLAQREALQCLRLGRRYTHSPQYVRGNVTLKMEQIEALVDQAAQDIDEFDIELLQQIKQTVRRGIRTPHHEKLLSIANQIHSEIIGKIEEPEEVPLETEAPTLSGDAA